jgi:hypothetical protein
LYIYGIVPFGGPCTNSLTIIEGKTFRRIECRPEDDRLNAGLWGLAIGEQIYTSRVATQNDVGVKFFDFSDDGIEVIGCSVEVGMGEELCESCEVCSTEDGYVGSNVTCSFSAEFDTNGTCLEDPLLTNARRDSTAVSAQSFNEVAAKLFKIYGVCANNTIPEAGTSNPRYLSVERNVYCNASDGDMPSALLLGNALDPHGDQVPIRTLQTCNTSSAGTSVCQILFYDDAGMEVDSCGVFVNGSAVHGNCQVCVDDDGVIGVLITDCPDCPIISTNAGTCVPNPVGLLGYIIPAPPPTTSMPTQPPTSMPTQPPTSDAGPPFDMTTALLFVVGMVVCSVN